MKWIAISIVALLIVPVAHAAPNCKWNTVPANINFGSYSVFGGQVTANSAFEIECPPPAIAQLTLSTGNSGSYNRAMPRTTAPPETLGYNLFMDAAGLIIWGDGTSGTQFLTFDPGPGNKEYAGQIYGIIPAGLDAAPGTYTDTIQATLNWGGGIDQRFFTVTSTVIPECIVSTAPLNFGNYDPVVAHAASPLDNTTIVSVYCTKTTTASVALDLGLNAAGATRRMRTGAVFLAYELYLDSYATVWNAVNTNSGASTSKLTAINNGFTVFGRVPGGQDVPAGGYGDTITVTVNY